MARLFSRKFGSVEYAPGEEIAFPNGLPGFAGETLFLPVEVPDQLPLVYLQSTRTPELCFVAAPVNCVVTEYQLCPNPGDLNLIDLAPEAAQGPDTLCLTLLCVGQDGATANLRAPIVVNLRNRRGMQLIQPDDRYPFRYRLSSEGDAACS
jgi:flagellar assembly factor FliW